LYIRGVGMTADETERLVAEISPDLKNLVDADPRNNKEVVKAALWREFGGERQGALERRVEEKRKRISIVESERNERERELDEHRNELQALETRLENMEDENTERKEHWFEKVRMVPRQESHPIVQEAADELEMTAEQIIAEAYDE